MLIGIAPVNFVDKLFDRSATVWQTSSCRMSEPYLYSSVSRCFSHCCDGWLQSRHPRVARCACLHWCWCKHTRRSHLFVNRTMAHSVDWCCCLCHSHLQLFSLYSRDEGRSGHLDLSVFHVLHLFHKCFVFSEITLLQTDHQSEGIPVYHTEGYQEHITKLSINQSIN